RSIPRKRETILSASTIWCARGCSRRRIASAVAPAPRRREASAAEARIALGGEARHEAGGADELDQEVGGLDHGGFHVGVGRNANRAARAARSVRSGKLCERAPYRSGVANGSGVRRRPPPLLHRSASQRGAWRA